jgi:hypothetical protein
MVGGTTLSGTPFLNISFNSALAAISNECSIKVCFHLNNVGDNKPGIHWGLLHSWVVDLAKTRFQFIVPSKFQPSLPNIFKFPSPCSKIYEKLGNA